ncbi:uncharacterized protein LOC113234553 [Hyposmocoma kahamanoa]|uniref:uncharacterized protein LOC113234553 n=1 Tax=Hyposmocoma kahamanoa TaxID=1477025 RepID=UPI000E6D7BD9|nr:uncharacterized protein LOC113234553 [Hyposmocoma kahamanoa]
MDDNGKQASSYQLDQEILDARGINMTVDEVAGLTTVKYAERVQQLHLTEDDLAFLKGLRRRIKNRLASQNSRRRSMEHLRRLARELRALRACRDDATAERRSLTLQRDALRDTCTALRQYIAQSLEERCDTTEIPSLDLARITESPTKENPKKTETPVLSDCLTNKLDRDKHMFECRIDRIVQNSVNHIYRSERDKKIFAKTVFISERTNERNSNVKVIESKTVIQSINSTNVNNEKCMGMNGNDEVLNLSVNKRKSHGRKQSAPRRIAYACMESDDGVLDLKVKTEPQ